MKRSAAITILALGATAMVYQAGRRERQCTPETPDGQPVNCTSSSSRGSHSGSSRSVFSRSTSSTPAASRGGFGGSASGHGTGG